MMTMAMVRNSGSWNDCHGLVRHVGLMSTTGCDCFVFLAAVLVSGKINKKLNNS